MALFAAAQRALPDTKGPTMRSAQPGHELAARLRELGASAGSLEDALQPMLQAILETTGATAGALCLYDARQQALRLAAEIGLSDEGCGKLRNIARRGEGDSWGIPLHGLLNRRCYLIEHAARNRFVPPLIPDANKIETVACLPVYSGDTPLASLVLVTRAPHILGERELHGVEAPVHEIGRSIATMRERDLGRGTKTPMPASLPGVAADTSGGSATAVSADVPSAETAGLDAQIARVERERDRVAELETLRRDAQRTSETHAAELERLRTQLGEAEAGAAHAARAREELEVRLAAGIAAGRDELRQALRIELEHERQNARARASDILAGPPDDQGQIESLTMQLGVLRKELATVRATSVRAARIHARAMARQRVTNLCDVVHDLEGCADVIDRMRLTGAEPLREAAARFADIASKIDVDYGRADP